MATYITEYLTVLLFLLADESSAFALPTTTIRRFNTRTSQQPRPSLWQRQSSSPHHHTVTTTLHQSRDNDRARMEKSWENMMGEDWREFRAQLVAREHLDQEMNLGTSKAGQDGNKKEEGGIFGAITSIFKKDENKNKGSDNNTQTERDVVTKAAKTKKDETSSSSSGNIFDGVDVGGATKFSKIEVPMGCSDPFMDEEECHLIYDEPVVTLDKHRWAHPLFNVEPGCILVANEKLGGVFHQTVVLIIDHNEATGSTGMVINRPFPGNLMKIASDSESNIDTTLKTAFSKAPVAYGGPVMQDQFSTLHGFGEVKGSKKICPGVFVGGSARLMQEVRRNNLHPTQVLFVKGHAAWVPGQLTREIEKGVWYIAAASADFLLRYAGAPVSKDDNPSDLWADVMMCMGSKFESIATSHGGRGDDRMMP